MMRNDWLLVEDGDDVKLKKEERSLLMMYYRVRYVGRVET